ncbi:hypothetical protein GCM10009006_34350 [Haloarcula argentinensis]|uniref:Uncharacterized protein n=2 Tax=Haloarcula argentinensis TaxID=43776 RepID=A0A830FXA1_HALAR|nr:hypothetical protein GCM10009006_34350 [Haloarcula argentinensis]
MTSLSLPSSADFSLALGVISMVLLGISGFVLGVMKIRTWAVGMREGHESLLATDPPTDPTWAFDEHVSLKELLGAVARPTWLTGLLTIVTVGTLQSVMVTSTAGQFGQYIWPLTTYGMSDIGGLWSVVPLVHLPNFVVGMLILYTPARYTDAAVRVLAAHKDIPVTLPDVVPVAETRRVFATRYVLLVGVAGLATPVFYLGLLGTVPTVLPVIGINWVLLGYTPSGNITGLLDAYALIGWYLIGSVIARWRS